MNKNYKEPIIEMDSKHKQGKVLLIPKFYRYCLLLCCPGLSRTLYNLVSVIKKSHKQGPGIKQGIHTKEKVLIKFFFLLLNV
jgi:hypothetical protein